MWIWVFPCPEPLEASPNPRVARRLKVALPDATVAAVGEREVRTSPLSARPTEAPSPFWDGGGWAQRGLAGGSPFAVDEDLRQAFTLRNRMTIRKRRSGIPITSPAIPPGEREGGLVVFIGEAGSESVRGGGASGKGARESTPTAPICAMTVPPKSVALISLSPAMEKSGQMFDALKMGVGEEKSAAARSMMAAARSPVLLEARVNAHGC